MKKRNQLQIGIDALKKQLQKYKEQHIKAVEVEKAACKSADFFLTEIERLQTQIKQLEKPAESVEHDKVLKALEG